MIFEENQRILMFLEFRELRSNGEIRRHLITIVIGKGRFIMSDLERMKELVEQLDAAARAYYQESKELMSNKEYDELYDELAAFEKKTGTVLAKSPTAHAGYEVLSALPKGRSKISCVSATDRSSESIKCRISFSPLFTFFQPRIILYPHGY